MTQEFSRRIPRACAGRNFDSRGPMDGAMQKAAFDMLQFELRLRSRLRQLISTTPRPTALLKRLMCHPSSTTPRAPTSLQGVMRAALCGARPGQQQLDGEIIEDRADAM